MLGFLNAGFGNPLPPEDWEFLRGLGCQGIRQDIPRGCQTGKVFELVRNALPDDDPERRAIFVLDADDSQRLAFEVSQALAAIGAEERAIVEVGNELDLERNGWSARAVEYGKVLSEACSLLGLASPVIRVLTAGISSPSRKALQWLTLALSEAPATVGVAYHTYRPGDVMKPLSGFDSRAAEFRALRAVAGIRPIWNTETGWSMAPRPRPFPECLWKGKVRHTAEQVGAWLESEIHLNRLHGAKSVCVYQLNDGPTDTDQDRFGLRDFAGQPKVSAEYVRRALSV